MMNLVKMISQATAIEKKLEEMGRFTLKDVSDEIIATDLNRADAIALAILIGSELDEPEIVDKETEEEGGE